MVNLVTHVSVSADSEAVTVSTAGSIVNPVAASSPSSSPPLPMAPQEANPHAIPRRHAPVEALARQGSFRGFPALSQKTSPFKRQMSLRMNDLPSTMQRKSDFPIKNTGQGCRMHSVFSHSDIQLTTCAISVPKLGMCPPALKAVITL